jgi:hypothetical protein
MARPKNHHFDWVRFHFAGRDFRRDLDDSLYRADFPDSIALLRAEFLELHFDEIPAFIAGYAYGPWTAFASFSSKR